MPHRHRDRHRYPASHGARPEHRLLLALADALLTLVAWAWRRARRR